MKNFKLIALFALLFSVSNTNAQSAIFTEGYASGVSFVPFDGSTNNVTDDGTVAYSGTHSLKIEFTTGYTGGALVAATPKNVSTYNAVSFWVKASASRTLDKAGLSNNATAAVFQTEYLNIPVTATWTKVVIPIPNPSKLTAETGLFHFAEGDAGGAYTIWMDDIQYETTTVGAATAAMATETLSKTIGQTFSPNGATCSFGGTPLSITAACFTYTSSNTAVATVNNATGVVTAVAGGTAAITATMGATTVSGTLTVNVTAAASGPTTAAPTPTKLAANVKSLFSNAYTNLPTDTWRTDWSNGGTLTDIQIAGNDTKKYENLTFAGITFEGAKKINATLMTGFHLDIWTADAAGTDFKVKLVDFGADGNYGGGDDTESGPIALTAPGVTASTWSAYDLPLSAFMGAGKLAARANLAQMVIETSAGKTIWIDNVYFYNTTALAVELTHFKAKTVDKTTVLNWETASESKNKGFSIERSNDGTAYTTIGDVKGNGTTNTMHTYTFTDATPSVGINYYRLRQVDFDGTETLSKAVSVVQGKNILVLKNTLVHDVLDVTVGEAVKTPLSILNVSGQLVYTTILQGNQVLDLSALTSGLYIIRTAAGQVSRFVKD